MGRLHVSLTSRLSIKGSPRKNCLKMGRRTKKFEKSWPRRCHLRKSYVCTSFVRRVLLQVLKQEVKTNALIFKATHLSQPLPSFCARKTRQSFWTNYIIK